MASTAQAASAKIRSADLQVQQLLTFRNVYRLGGYSPAAAESGVSVTTVWQHIQSLEKQYETKLFEKSGRAVRPTDAAHQLFRVLGELLAGLESTFDLVGGDAAETRPLTLVAGVRMMMEDLAVPLAKFRKNSPRPLVIRHGNNKRAEELILTGEADLALTLEPGVGLACSSIHYQPSYCVDFLAIAPKGHAYAKKNTSSLRELVNHPLIVSVQGTHGRDALEQALLRDRLKPTIAAETENSAFTIACVQAGMGVGILAGRPKAPLCSKLAARSLRKQLGRRQIMFMWRNGRHLSDSERDLIDIINESHGRNTNGSDRRF